MDHAIGHRHPARLAIAIFAALALFLGLAPTHAQAASSGSIAGHVTDSHGAINGARVVAMGPDTDTTQHQATTDASGAYLLEDLDPGKYTVFAFATNHLLKYFDADGDETTDPQTVIAGHAVSGINFTLTRTAKVQGTVKLPNGHGAANAPATMWSYRGTSGSGFTTDADGHFSGEVPPGKYLLRAEIPGSYPFTFYNSSASTSLEAQASVITLPEDGQFNGSITLKTGTWFSGTVLSDGSVPANQMAVLASQKQGNDWSLPLAQAFTETDGTYRILVGQGSYLLAFSDAVAHRYDQRLITVTATTPATTINANCLALYASTTAPTVSGTAKIGSILSANPGTWSPQPTSFSYQWQRNGTAIAGATQVNYKVTTADAGFRLSVVTTAHTLGYFADSRDSASTAVIPYLKMTGTAPKIVGTAKVKRTLKVTLGTWTPRGATFTYQWYRNGKAIKGATKSSYKLTKTDKGRYIQIRAYGRAVGYTPLGLTSKKTARVR